MDAHPDEATVLWDLEDYARKQAKYVKRHKRGRSWWEPHTSERTTTLTVKLGELVNLFIIYSKNE